MTLTKNEILQKSKPKKKSFAIASLDGEVYLQQLSASVVMDLYQLVQTGKLTEKEYTYESIMLSVVDETGDPIYTLEDVKGMNVDVMTELSVAITSFNNFDIKGNSGVDNQKNLEKK